MESKHKITLASASFISLALAIGFTLNVVTFPILIIAAVAGLTGLLFYTGLMQKIRKQYREKVDKQNPSSGAVDSNSDFDQLWNDLQEWYRGDPWNSELVWVEGDSMFTSTVPSSIDGDYRFIAVICQSKKTKSNVFIVVEGATGSLIHVDEKGEVNRKYPFQRVPLIRDIRKRRIDQDSLENKIEQVREANLQGSQYLNIPARTVRSPDSLEGEAQ